MCSDHLTRREAVDSAGPEATGLEFTVFGRLVRVDCQGPCQAELAAAALAAFEDVGGRPAAGGVPDLVVDTAGRDLPSLLEELGRRLCQWAIHARRDDLLMFHASGVADPDTGASVVFLGRSGAGKSTAASTLGRDWAYLGDEVVGVRDDGGIVALPKPVSLIVDGQSAKAQLPMATLGLIPPPADPWLAGLVVLDRRPGAALSVEVLATIDALPLLAPQVSYLGSHRRPLHRLAGAAELAGGVRRAEYGEAAQLSELVRTLVLGVAR